MANTKMKPMYVELVCKNNDMSDLTISRTYLVSPKNQIRGGHYDVLCNVIIGGIVYDMYRFDVIERK
jgi:hypothetical protein